jgi:hypothetical protein
MLSSLHSGPQAPALTSGTPLPSLTTLPDHFHSGPVNFPSTHSQTPLLQALPLLSTPTSAAETSDTPPPPLPHGTLFQRSLRLGAVLSPTDNAAILHFVSPSSQPVLHSLLFGEGVMNDVTAVLLLRAAAGTAAGTPAGLWAVFQEFFFTFLASSAIGIAGGLLSAIVTKRAAPQLILATPLCFSHCPFTSITEVLTLKVSDSVDAHIATPNP